MAGEERRLGNSQINGSNNDYFLPNAFGLTCQLINASRAVALDPEIEIDDARYASDALNNMDEAAQISFNAVLQDGVFYSGIDGVGPIPEKQLANFTQGLANPTIYPEGSTLFRISSPGGEYNSWWNTEPPEGILQWRIDNAVPPEWGNTAEKISILTVPTGENLGGWLGSAEYQGGIYIGQGNQIYLPVVPENWIKTMNFSDFQGMH